MKSVDTSSYIKKIYNGLMKMKKKYVTSELLSKSIGLYPEVINEALSIFNPMISMDFNFNLMDIVPYMERYLDDLEKEKETIPSEETQRISKKDVLQYETIGDFFYKKMTIGGIVDRDVVLTTEDLKILKKLVNNELETRKPKKKRKKR